MTVGCGLLPTDVAAASRTETVVSAEPAPTIAIRLPSGDQAGKPNVTPGWIDSCRGRPVRSTTETAPALSRKATVPANLGNVRPAVIPLSPGDSSAEFGLLAGDPVAAASGDVDPRD